MHPRRLLEQLETCLVAAVAAAPHPFRGPAAPIAAAALSSRPALLTVDSMGKGGKRATVPLGGRLDPALARPVTAVPLRRGRARIAPITPNPC